MKKGFGSFSAGMLTMLLIVSLVGTALAVTGKVTKEIEYNNISVTLDGKKLDLKDAKGNPVEPFKFDGTNYLPVRALADALGMGVAWDSATQTVKLTSAGTVATPPAPSAAYSRTNPAPVGSEQAITIKDYSSSRNVTITINEVLRGSEAWSKIIAANQFNSPAPDGKEYILAKVTGLVNSSSDDKAVSFSDYNFKVFSSANSEYAQESVVEPTPKFRGDAYVGASISGYIVFTVDKSDTAPKIVYGAKYDGSGGIWFSLA